MLYTKTLIPGLYCIAQLLLWPTLCLAAGTLPEKQSPSFAERSEFSAVQKDTLLSRFEFHASLSQGYLISNKNDWVAETESGTWDFNEFIANLSYDFNDQFRAGFQFVSRDFGPLMNNKVYLDWAVVDYNWRNELGIRLGRLRTPFGLYNESRDVDSARISIILPTGVYPERARDQGESLNGGALYGTFEMGSAGSMEYFAAYGTKDVFKEGGTAHFFESGDNTLDLGTISKMHVDNFLNLQLSYDTPIDGLRLVGSYAESDFLLEARSSIGGVPGGPATLYVPDVNIWAASIEYTVNDFIFAAEYRQFQAVDQTFTFEHALAGTVSVSSTIPTMGWYISGSYRVTDWFAAEIYYSELYPNSDDRDGARFIARGQDNFQAWQKDISLTGRFDLTKNLIFKAGVTFSDGLAGSFPTFYPEAGVASRDWILYQFKATFVF